jgi:glycosyltransferase involved in cell wall biosynthesis
MKSNSQEPKIAIVVDSIDVLGGAENVLKQLLFEFPNAKVFTVRSNKKFLKQEFPNLKVKNSFIQYFPFEKFLRKELYLLYPWAYRSFSFLGYDIVISISASFAKYIKPWSSKTKHIGYILTPPRFFWLHDVRSTKDMQKLSYKFYSFFISTFLEKIWQYWDKKAARNIDVPISISKDVQKRVKTYYEMNSDVIYPPVHVTDMPFVKDIHKRENWFLYLGRVETYKGVELAIRACAMAKKPLKVAGTGSQLQALQELVKELNAKGIVKFLGFYTDEQKEILLSKCKALISPIQNEDFGIVPVEANAAGAPVIAYGKGGVLETISKNNPKTGMFFKDYTPESLAKVLESFNPEDFDPNNCRKQASLFAQEIFRYKMKNLVNEVFESSK